MTIKPDNDASWTLVTHPALASEHRTKALDTEAKKEGRNLVMDLLESISRSGEMVLSSGSLHIVLGQSHAFSKTLMSTLAKDNVNPIQSVEYTTLIAASTIHQQPAAQLLKPSQRQRVASLFPSLS